MAEFALVLLIALFSGFDFQTTTRRLGLFGLAVELNPIARWLIEKLGNVPGVALSIAVPASLWTAFFLAWDLDLALAFYAGMKGELVRAQIYSFKLEQKIAEELGLPLKPERPPSDGEAK